MNNIGYYDDYALNKTPRITGKRGVTKRTKKKYILLRSGEKKKKKKYIFFFILMERKKKDLFFSPLHNSFLFIIFI